MAPFITTTVGSLFFLLTLVAAVRINAERCDRVKIGDDFYKRLLIATIDGLPSGLVSDPRNGNLFFILHKKNFTKGIHLLKHGSLGIKPLPVADENLKGQCVGVDAINNIIYIGTNQGILTYEYPKSVITADRPFGDDDIKNIYLDKISNQLYITTGVHHEIYLFMNSTSAVKRFDKISKAFSFLIDSKGSIFYEYIDGRLYFLSADLFEPVQYKGMARELKYVLQLNNHDEAILAVKTSLYKLTARDLLPVKLADLGFKITGMVIDHKNNFIIGTKGKIYRFKPVDISEPCPNDDYFMANI